MTAIQMAEGCVAGASPKTNVTAGILSRIAEWHRRRQIRKSYGRMPDDHLRDIGLTPHDIVRALYLPWNQSAANDIARAAKAEASRW